MKRLGPLLGMLLLGCGTPEPPPLVVVAAVADQERVVAMLKEFAAASGIRVDIRPGSPAGQVDAMIAKTGDPVDVLITDDLVQIWRAADRGVLRPIRSDGLGRHHASLRDPDSLWFVQEIRPVTVARAEDTAPWMVSFDELGTPPFEGRLCLSTAAGVDNRALIAHLIEQRGELETERLVRRWVRNLAQAPYANEASLRSAIQSGVCAYGIVSNPHTVFGNWERFPQPHAYVGTAVGVGRHAASPDAAQMLADWLLRNQSVRIPSYTELPRAGIPGWRDAEARRLAERAGYR